MESGTIKVIECFVDYGFWMEYTGSITKQTTVQGFVTAQPGPTTGETSAAELDSISPDPPTTKASVEGLVHSQSDPTATANSIEEINCVPHGPSKIQSTIHQPAHAQLFIGESKIGGAGQFLSGIGQKAGLISKVQIRGSTSDYFFVVVSRDGSTYKYKLRRSNIMCPVPDEALEIRPRVPGLKAVAAFWSLLPSTVADSRRAVVAAAKLMMATALDQYRDGLDYIRRNRRRADHTTSPSNLQGVQAEPLLSPPPEDPLTAPFARCFAKVPHHPDFGIPRPIRRSTYTPDLLAESRRNVREEDFEGENYSISPEHDIHEDDTEFIEEDGGSDEDKEDGDAKYRMSGPTPVAELEAGIIQGREHEFLVNMANVIEPTSPLTNMRILDKEQAKEIYTRLLKKQNVSSLTLRPLSYCDVHSGARIEFKLIGGREQFLEVWRNWPEGSTDDEKRRNMMDTIIWEPCDGQHIVHACNVLAEEAFATGDINEADMTTIFRQRPAIPVVYNNPRMYIEMSKRQNDFHRPNRKDTHAVAWQTLIKLRNLWNEYERPKAKDEKNIGKRGDMFICMAAVLNLKLDVQESWNITKVSSKLYDWITHACREDEEAFDALIRLGQEVDARLLHQDPAIQSAWNNFLKKKENNEKAKEPKKLPMTINWLRPLRGLQDKDFKEIIQMALYDHTRKRQRLYFHDVEKAHPRRNTLEYVSMRLRQRYAVRNALRWLEIEGTTSGYKKMEEFMKINVERFGGHDTLVALGQLGTKSFINHWASPLYIYVSALKKYATEIPVALRAHHKDIVSGGTGFSGKVKMIGAKMYGLSGWLWETHLQKPLKGFEGVRDIHIMHRGGLFSGGSGELGEPALWVADCRWGSSAREEKAWAFQDYETTIEIIGSWMKACPRWNLIFLCPEGEDRRSLVEDLKQSGRMIHHGAWGFTPKTSTEKRTMTFDGQDVIWMEEIGDIIFVMVYPEASNPIENIPHGCRTVPRVFHDHTSKYPTEQWDNKRRTPEELVRLISTYLPKDWALVLVNLSTSIQAITEEGFIGSRILTLDGSGQRSSMLSKWIQEHEGVQFQYPSEEAQVTQKPVHSNSERSTTPDLEPLIRMAEACSQEYVDIQDSGMVNLQEKITVEEHVQELDREDSTTEKTICQTAAYCAANEANEEPDEEIAKAISQRRSKRKRLDRHFLVAEGAVQNQTTGGAQQSKRSNEGRIEKENIAYPLSTLEMTQASKHVSRKKRSKSKRKTSTTILETHDIASPTTTPIPESSMNTNTTTLHTSNNSIATNDLVTSESTQMALKRVLQQLNSQGLFDISDSGHDDPYNFNKDIPTTEWSNAARQLNVNVAEDTNILQEHNTCHGSAIDPTSIILETQEVEIHGFQLGEKVSLLHIIDDVVVAIATISSTTNASQLHNRLQPHGYYKVSIENVVVGEASLMITNTDDDPPQLVVQDAIGTMTAWRWDRIRRMS